MKSLIVIALALTSVASFSATKAKTAVKSEVKTEACANLKGAELSACEAKNVKTNAPVAEVKQEAKKEENVAKKEEKVAKKVSKKVSKNEASVTANNSKAAATTESAKK